MGNDLAELNWLACKEKIYDNYKLYRKLLYFFLSGGSGGSAGGIMAALRRATPVDYYPQNGDKPLGEFPDRCAGTQGLWNLGVANGNAETFGYLTADGKVIATAVLGPMGGSSGGLYTFDSGTGINTYYYTYPLGQGIPTQLYVGMKVVNGQYYIPVVASVHTHTPCLTDGTDGVTNHTLSQPDQDLANDKQGLRHYIIGCGATGIFDNTSTLPTVLGTGGLSIICSFVQ